MKCSIPFLVFIMIHLNAWSQISKQDLTGFWEGVIIPGEEIIHEFNIRRLNKNKWEATLISGDTMRRSIALKDESVRVEFPERLVNFTGSINKSNNNIEGYWKRENWTRPLELHHVSKDKWTSRPPTTKKDFVVLLKLFLDSDGYLTGEIHNQDNNMANFIPIKKVHLAENKLQFELEYFTGYELRGVYERGKIILESKRGSNWYPFTMERIVEEDAIYYQPLLEEYEYDIPELNSDGWSVSSLVGEGIEEQPIIDLMKEIKSEKYPHVHNMTIAKNNKLVLDEYFYGHDASEIHEIRSVSKSFTSALVGIAIDKGFILSVDDPIWTYLKHYRYDNVKNPDPRKEAITIRHLLTMTSGLDNHDNDPSSVGLEMKMKRQVEQQDWVKFQLDLPMIEKPGTVFRYSSGGLNIISAIIEDASGLSLTEFIDQYLFEPLEITDYQLFHSPDSRVYLGGDFKLKPRDLAKFGQLYLSDGIWNGKQIVSSKWIDESSKVQVEQIGYGFAWWLPTLKADEKDFQSIYVGGNGGQSIIIVRELDLVVVFAGGNFNADLFDTRKIVEKYIIPAID